MKRAFVLLALVALAFPASLAQSLSAESVTSGESTSRGPSRVPRGLRTAREDIPIACPIRADSDAEPRAQAWPKSPAPLQFPADPSPSTLGQLSRAWGGRSRVAHAPVRLLHRPFAPPLPAPRDLSDSPPLPSLSPLASLAVFQAWADAMSEQLDREKQTSGRHLLQDDSTSATSGLLGTLETAATVRPTAASRGATAAGRLARARRGTARRSSAVRATSPFQS